MPDKLNGFSNAVTNRAAVALTFDHGDGLHDRARRGKSKVCRRWVEYSDNGYHAENFSITRIPLQKLKFHTKASLHLLVAQQ